MFKAIAASVSVLALTVGAGLAATSAHAAIPFHGPFTHASQTTELSPVLFGDAWVLNNFQGLGGNNNIASVYDDTGAQRSKFTVRVVPDAGLTVDGVTGTEVVTIRDNKGAYLSDWNETNPAVEGYRGRWVHPFNNNPLGNTAFEWLVVPEGSAFALINDASPSDTNDVALALTVAEGGSNVEATLPQAWSDTALLPYTAGDTAQEWNGDLNPVHHNPNPHPTGTFTPGPNHHGHGELTIVKTQSLDNANGPFTTADLAGSLNNSTDYYQVTVHNGTGVTLTDVQVLDTDSTISGVTSSDVDNNLAGTVSVDNSGVVCPDTTLAPGASEVCTVDVTGNDVESGLNQLYSNNVSNSGGIQYGDVDSVTLNNQAVVSATGQTDVDSNTVHVTYTR